MLLRPFRRPAATLTHPTHATVTAALLRLLRDARLDARAARHDADEARAQLEELRNKVDRACPDDERPAHRRLVAAQADLIDRLTRANHDRDAAGLEALRGRPRTRPEPAGHPYTAGPGGQGAPADIATARLIDEEAS